MGLFRTGFSIVATVAIGCNTPPSAPAGKPAVVRAKPLPARPIHAIHGAPIALIAITAEGDAAVTADELGAFRLWPSFDGTKEPLVIQAQAPRALTIAHDRDGFAIAVLDRAGLIEIVGLGPDGTERSRVALDGAAIAVTATSRGFVAIGEDRALAITDLAGTVRARLAPEPGWRIESLAAAGDKLLAIATVVDGGVHGRWIDIEHAAWGAPTRQLQGLVPTGIVLAPDALTVLGKGPAEATAHTVSVSLETGQATELEACTSGALLGFVDADTLACFDGDLVAWWHGKERVKSTAVANGTAQTIGLAGGIVVAGYQAQLALVAPMHAEYLGYDAATVPSARYTAAGIVVGRGEAVVHLLDADFQSRPELALPPTTNPWLDVVPIDARYTLTLRDKQIAVYDRDTRQLGPALAYSGREDQLDFEPATGILLGADARGKTMQLVDPMTGALGKPRALDVPLAFLVDPALADGVAVLAADIASEPGLRVTEYTASGEPRKSYLVRGELRAIDRAGRFYMAVPGVPPGDVAIFERGEPVGTLPNIASQIVRPSPDGTTIATASPTTISLLERDGTVRWAMPAIAVTELAWQGNALIAQFATGLVRYDVATGQALARKCGWGFGRFETPRTSSTEESFVCD